MAVRSAQVIDSDGELAAPYTPGASDTFHVNDLPGILEFNNTGGVSANVTLSDGGRTAAGSAAAAGTPVAVAAGAKRRFKLTKEYAASDGYVTVSFSAQPANSCEFFKL